MYTSQTGLVEFHRFNDLPVELVRMIWRAAASEYMDTVSLAQTVFYTHTVSDDRFHFKLEQTDKPDAQLGILRCPLSATTHLSRDEIILEYRCRVQRMGPVYYVRPADPLWGLPLRQSTSPWNPAQGPSSLVISSLRKRCTPDMVWFPRSVCAAHNLISTNGYVENIYVIGYWRRLEGLTNSVSRGEDTYSGLTEKRFFGFSLVLPGEPIIKTVRKEDAGPVGQSVIVSNELHRNTPGGVTKHDVVACLEWDEVNQTVSFVFPNSWKDGSWGFSNARAVYRQLRADFDILSYDNGRLKRLTILI